MIKNPDQTINGKKALLTGGLGSLGRAQALLLSSQGVKVTVLDIKSIAELTLPDIKSYQSIDFVQCDLNDLKETG